jgi:hypothetical protein
LPADSLDAEIGERGDGGAGGVDTVEHHPAEERVMVAEPADQCLA